LGLCTGLLCSPHVPTTTIDTGASL
jgi:hypothetical protein